MKVRITTFIRTIVLLSIFTSILEIQAQVIRRIDNKVLVLYSGDLWNEDTLYVFNRKTVIKILKAQDLCALYKTYYVTCDSALNNCKILTNKQEELIRTKDQEVSLLVEKNTLLTQETTVLNKQILDERHSKNFWKTTTFSLGGGLVISMAVLFLLLMK
ncbi:MAG: hypothetical protein QXE78_01905 [Nitrososphaeria archaeon]